MMKETAALSKGDVFDPESSRQCEARGPGESIARDGRPEPPAVDVGRARNCSRNGWRRFIAGKVDYKPRTLDDRAHARLPRAARSSRKGLAMEHGCPRHHRRRPSADEELAERQAAGRPKGGFSCMQCHGIGDIAPISPFEAPSINFKYTSERIRKEYYDRWMRNPLRLVPTTKMPEFADRKGKRRCG